MKITIRNKNNEVDVKNIVKDSWFSSSGITLTKTNNIYKADYTNNTQRYGSISQEIIGTHAIIGHKYFLYFRIKSSVALNMVYVTFNDAGMSGIRVGTEWTDVIYKMTCSYTSGSYFRIYPNTSTNIYTGIFEFQDDVIYIDLTESGDEDLTAQQIYDKYKNHFNELKNGGTYNPGSFEVDEGAVITENYNETLDSAIVSISNLSSEIEIEPYDTVILSDFQMEDKYMCVDTYQQTMTCCIEGKEKYKYSISLFSETKLLENTLLPNLAITQLQINKRSIWYYLNQYMNEYSPKKRFIGLSPEPPLSATTWLYNEFIFDSSVQEKFNSVECPEMQWNQPTLREVINDLMMVSDCIPFVKNRVIYFINLSETKSDISSNENINYIQKSKSSSDYVSELKCDLVNVMQTKLTDINDVVTKCEFISYTSDSYLITSQNFFLKTSYPILRVKHLYMLFNKGGRWIKKDLCNMDGYSLVSEYQEYITKKIDFRLPVQDSYTWEQVSSFQNYSVYYNRGSNIINGFSRKTETKSATRYTCQLSQMLMSKIIGGHLAYTGQSQESEQKYFIPLFQIEYETTIDSVFSASKGEYPGVDKTVMDNQTNSYVDAYSQGFLEYQKANRLGNEQLFINARYNSSFTDLIKIGDFYNDSIIYSCQYQIYKNHIEVNCQATKNYVLKDYFTGVKSKIRSWKIVSGGEALTRHDLIKYYCEFSFKQKSCSWNEKLETDLTKYFTDDLILSRGSDITIKYSANKYKVDDSYYPGGGYYALDSVSRIIGNSIVFTSGYLDNIEVAKYVDTDEITINDLQTTGFGPGIKNSSVDGFGGIPLQFYRYADLNGENVGGSIIYSSDISSTNNEFAVPSDGAESTDDDAKRMKIISFEKPFVYNASLSSQEIKITYNYHKDNREISMISTQFEFISDTNDIYVGRKFIEFQRAVNKGTFIRNLKAFVDDANTYNFRNPTVSGTRYNCQPSRFNINNNSRKIRFVLNGLTETLTNKIVYITNGDNNDLFFAIKMDEIVNGTIELYLNILRLRDENIYGDRNYKIIGTIEN